MTWQTGGLYIFSAGMYQVQDSLVGDPAPGHQASCVAVEVAGEKEALERLVPVELALLRRQTSRSESRSYLLSLCMSVHFEAGFSFPKSI